MSGLIEVTLLDGSTDIVTVAEAIQMRRNGELAPAPDDSSALTIEDVYGEGYDERYKGT